MYKRNGAYAMCFSNMCPPLEITSVLASYVSSSPTKLAKKKLLIQVPLRQQHLKQNGII